MTPTVTRAFGLKYSEGDHPTKVKMHEFSDGSIVVTLSTVRAGMEPLETRFGLTPLTFSLLSEAMHRAAHDPTVWVDIETPPKDKP